MSLSFGHHVGVKTLASIGYSMGKVPTSGHHVGRKLANGFHARTCWIICH